MGVMYFGRYVRFAEIAETEFFRTVGYAYDELHAEFGIWLARIRLEIDYRSPAKLDEEIVCRTELRKLSAASMHFGFPIERLTDGTRLADISLIVACLDAATLKSRRTPARLRERLEPFIHRT
jgi:acyl-CoA thioester hydrolase